MWSFDMNCCVNCAKIKTCPDASVLQQGLRGLLDTLSGNEGGSAAGIVVVVCKDRE
ncbi:MAG: hypothetical protein HZB62_10810 [Nitrospirae bacterium]|nr:hypothetical protein [Nitrospirota bacterium]